MIMQKIRKHSTKNGSFYTLKILKIEIRHIQLCYIKHNKNIKHKKCYKMKGRKKMLLKLKKKVIK